MKEISFEESRSIILDITRDIDAFCRREGIEYSLAEGSLIGAIRHQGIIPWDDDLDILMLRENYERFCNTYKSDKYYLQKCDFNLNSWLLCVKITDPRTIVKFNDSGEEPLGLWVTVFPIDNAPDDDKEVFKMEKNIKKYMRLFRIRNHAWSRGKVFRDFFFSVIQLALLPFPKDYWHLKAEKEMVKYNHLNTKRRGSFAFWGAKHHPWVCSANAFNEYIDTPFENKRFRIIKGYDEYLRCQYGDYMQLPPEEKRIPKHDYTPYWK